MDLVKILPDHLDNTLISIATVDIAIVIIVDKDLGYSITNRYFIIAVDLNKDYSFNSNLHIITIVHHIVLHLMLVLIVLDLQNALNNFPNLIN